jgi:hypothetical protein
MNYLESEITKVKTKRFFGIQLFEFSKVLKQSPICYTNIYRMLSIA